MRERDRDDTHTARLTTCPISVPRASRSRVTNTDYNCSNTEGPAPATSGSILRVNVLAAYADSMAIRRRVQRWCNQWNGAKIAIANQNEARQLPDRWKRLRTSVSQRLPANFQKRRDNIRSHCRSVWRDFSVEIITAGIVAVILLASLIYLVSAQISPSLESVVSAPAPTRRLPPESLAALSFLLAALTFMMGQFYGRLKDRREAKRNRALQLFYEFHSPLFRKSRQYVSHWIDVKGCGDIASSPGLRQIELASMEAYIARVTPNEAGEFVEIKYASELENPELIEEHFFAIYQFFERWSMIVENKEIEERDADVYMSSYKGWYVEMFVRHWYSVETDETIAKAQRDIHIKDSLEKILRYVVRDSKFITK